jgi:DNA-binding SARP family transcriptional activator
MDPVRLRLSLLGTPRVAGPAGPVALPTRKAQALLYYLASQPGRPASRSRLAGLLWDERPEAQGRANLSTVLSRLRATLPVWPLGVDSASVRCPGCQVGR